MKLLTAAEMRALDHAAIASDVATGEALMQRAGDAVAAAIERRWGDPLALRVLVLCGAGNNGGDGFVAARALAARGADVVVGLLGDPARVQGDARTHLDRLPEADLAAVTLADEAALAAVVASRSQWDFAIDAVLGTGARGAPEALAALAVQALRELDDRGVRVIAVDLPTGVDADTGAVARRAVRASLTVTFGEPKRGHFLYPGRAFCGAVEVADIGLPPADAHPFEVATAAAMAAMVSPRDPRAHKGSVGRVRVVGGSPGRTGAVALAARAASRAGAGSVVAFVPSSVHDILEIKLTEEMTQPGEETAARTLSARNEQALYALDGPGVAWAIGMGLGLGDEPARLVRALASGASAPMVIDADALTALAEDGIDRLRAAPGARVLTPHLGEMSRLTGLDAAALEAGRLDLAREWAMRWGVVLVLKGAPTVVAAADGRAAVIPTGNPGMAAAGMGDVLAGAIAALAAGGRDAWDAARLGAYVHGRAGDLAAARIGPLGLVAGDVAEALPAALAELALHARR